MPAKGANIQVDAPPQERRVPEGPNGVRIRSVDRTFHTRRGAVAALASKSRDAPAAALVALGGAARAHAPGDAGLAREPAGARAEDGCARDPRRRGGGGARRSGGGDVVAPGPRGGRARGAAPTAASPHRTRGHRAARARARGARDLPMSASSRSGDATLAG